MGNGPSGELDQLVSDGDLDATGDVESSASISSGASGTSSASSSSGTGGASGTSSASGSKRGRGRPPKSASGKAPRGGADSVVLRVDESPRAPRRERPPAAPKPGTPAETAASAQMVVTTLLDLVQLAAMATVGPHAALNPIERGMVEPAAVRILARMDDAAVARYGALADPIVLAMGLGLWGMRIVAAQRQRQAEPPATDTPNRAEPSRGTTEPPAESADGSGGSAAPPIPEQSTNGYAPIPLVIAGHIHDDTTGF